MHYSKNLAESLRSFNSQVHYLCPSGEGSWGGGTGAAEQTGSIISEAAGVGGISHFSGMTATPLLPGSVTVSLPPPPAQLRR